MRGVIQASDILSEIGPQRMSQRRIIMRIHRQGIPVRIRIRADRIVFQRSIEILKSSQIIYRCSQLKPPLIGPPVISSKQFRGFKFIQYKLAVYLHPAEQSRFEIETQKHIIGAPDGVFHSSEKYHRQQIVPFQLLIPVENHGLKKSKMGLVPQFKLEHMSGHKLFGQQLITRYLSSTFRCQLSDHIPISQSPYFEVEVQM